MVYKFVLNADRRYWIRMSTVKTGGHQYYLCYFDKKTVPWPSQEGTPLAQFFSSFAIWTFRFNDFSLFIVMTFTEGLSWYSINNSMYAYWRFLDYKGLLRYSITTACMHIEGSLTIHAYMLVLVGLPFCLYLSWYFSISFGPSSVIFHVTVWLPSRNALL